MKTLIMVLITKIFGENIRLKGEDFAGAFAILGILGFIIYLTIPKIFKKLRNRK